MRKYEISLDVTCTNEYNDTISNEDFQNCLCESPLMHPSDELTGFRAGDLLPTGVYLFRGNGLTYERTEIIWQSPTLI